MGEMLTGSHVSLLMHCAQQILIAVLSAGTIDGSILVVVSSILLTVNSPGLLLVFSAVTYWLYGIRCTIFYLSLAAFVRVVGFLTPFETTIVLLVTILSWQNMTNAISLSGSAVQGYSVSSSMHFVSIAYICVASGCFVTWLAFECLNNIATHTGLSALLKGRHWLLKSTFLSCTVAIVVYLVDAVSMINWMFCFVAFSNNGLVAKLCGVWSVLIAVTVVISNHLSTLRNLKKTIVRKLFHLLAFLLFTPALLLQLHSFLCLSIGLVMCLFMLLEFMRVYVFADFTASQPAFSYMSISATYFTWFAHKKELQQRQGVVLSHITLLSGCAYSIFLYSSMLPLTHSASSTDSCLLRELALRLLPQLGIVSVCIADSLASVCGSLWGRRKWHSGSSRTVLGSVAAFMGMLVTSVALLVVEYFIHGVGSVVLTVGNVVSLLLILVMVSGVTTLAEAFTTENDNLVLPFWSSCSYLLLIYLFL